MLNMNVRMNGIGRVIFTLIRINGHHCALSQNLFWPPFFKQNRFFHILFHNCECIHVLQLWAKFYWKIHLEFQIIFFSRNDNSFFWPTFWSKTVFLTFFLLIYGCVGWIHIECKFRTEIPTGKCSKMNGSLVHKREWKVAYARRC